MLAHRPQAGSLRSQLANQGEWFIDVGDMTLSLGIAGKDTKRDSLCWKCGGRPRIAGERRRTVSLPPRPHEVGRTLVSPIILPCRV